MSGRETSGEMCARAVCDVVAVGSYTQWGFNKPNNYGGNQYCGMTHIGVGHKFDDDKCGQTSASYICERRNNFIESRVTFHSHCLLL